MFLISIVLYIALVMSYSSSVITHRRVKCILTDMDGTLLNSKRVISDRTIAAIRECQSRGIQFYPATGRARHNMATIAGSTFVGIYGDVSKIPGVFSQGLIEKKMYREDKYWPLRGHSL